MKSLTLIIVAITPMLGLVSAQTFFPTTDDACAPSGTHPKQTTTGSCACNADGSVTCTGFQLCGVGNTNADVVLTSTYTATVRCRNHGGQIVDVKTQDVTDQAESKNIRSKNGCLSVPPESTSPAPTAGQLEDKATCPNNNWTKQLLAGTVSDTFKYTLTFTGQTCAYLTISGTCTPA